MATSWHSKVLAVKPKQEVKASTYWVAVLKSDNRPSDNPKEEDFLWIKCHGGITVNVICAQYCNKYPHEGRICLKQGPIFFPDNTSMRQLDEHEDRLVQFEAVKLLDSPSQMVGERVPLTPKTTQVFLRADLNHLSAKAQSEDAHHGGPPKPVVSNAEPHVHDENIKPELPKPSYQSPYIQPVAPPAPPVFRELAPQPEPVAPPQALHTSSTADLPEWATSNGFLHYAEENHSKYRARYPELTDAQITQIMHHSGWLQISPVQRQVHEDAARILAGTQTVKFEPIKSELDVKDILPVSQINDMFAQPEVQSFQIQSFFKDATPERLESGVAQGVKLLDQLKSQMCEQVGHSSDASQWTEQIDNLCKQAVKTKTIIGVVGNTGAGKSSVINALLDEERIIPTNCMRACTAVVTEISYNETEIPYHAQIEFIKASDWERELKTLFQDLLDSSGNVSRDCSNPDTDAGVAYAKIKAVYPKKTKEDIANSSIEIMLKEVSHILGTNREIKESNSLTFYKRLQMFVDSKEKSTGDKKERKELEFWPLIRVVRIHVKSPALSTGAVIVDLPGVQDSNAARAAVAANYMKQCTGLWIVAPINRAVDDKAAKNLMGESFKRQLKMDGGFNSVTFICSKTDDISLMEAQESLGLDDEMAPSWQKLDDLSKKQKSLGTQLKELKETKELLGATLNDADDQIEVWEALKESVEDGKNVFAPKSESSSKKRKGNSAKNRRKRQRRSADSDNDFIDDDDSGDSASEPDSEEEPDSAEPREPLTEDQVIAKISELRSTKKEARRQRAELADQMKELQEENEKAHDAEEKIEAEMSTLCISGRNGYSKGAIQNDFAQGLRELDEERAAEEDEENFNPENDARDYEAVARGLPVFCVSSRGYQKLQGRLQKDPKVPGFATVEETEMPQLQAHCKQLTEKGRTVNCQRFLNNLSQLLNSLSLWASNDGTGANMTADQRNREEKYLQKGLKELESGLEKAVADTCKDISEEFKDNIFDKYDPAIANATQMASTTAQQWGSRVNRDDRAAGGYHWSTYKAICRRNGEYSNAQGPHQWNYQLVEPMMRMLTSGWEKAFTRRLPVVMSAFVRCAAKLLKEFHKDVDGRARKVGAGIAGLHMLQQQLGVYETILKDLIGTVKDAINNGQKEINREFTPVIARAMIAAYEACVNESGCGSYMRMKAAMNAHVDQERHVMFQESANEVAKRLTKLVRSVEETMSNRVDEVFLGMRRDYRSVLGGGEDVQGQVLPKVQRLMRKEILKTIEGVEAYFMKVMDGDADEMEYDEERSDNVLTGEIDEGADEMNHDEEGDNKNLKMEDSSDEKLEINGNSGLESNSDQNVSAVSGSNKPSGSIAISDQKQATTSSGSETMDTKSDGGEREPDNMGTKEFDQKPSEDENQDPSSNSTPQTALQDQVQASRI